MKIRGVIKRLKKIKVIPNDWFIDDTPRKWVAREKRDKDELNVKQHLLIFHITIIARWFSDDLYPTLMDKCIQYHKERDLASLGVIPEAFYKSYSNIEYSYLKVPTEKTEDDKKRSKYFKEEKTPEFSFVRKKYISLELIDSVEPFILKWYPSAIFSVQKLNKTPDIFDENDYYWIYRMIIDHYPQEFKAFFDKNCPHLNFNAFKSIKRRKSDAQIPKDLHNRVFEYVRSNYPKAIEQADNSS